jgi:hypothetical protein
MRIMKNYSVGLWLTRQIDNLSPFCDILDQLRKELLQRVQPQDLMLAVERRMVEEYERGQRDKAEEIRKVLGLTEGG